MVFWSLPFSFFLTRFPQTKNSSSIEEACLQLSLDSEMSVPFACYECGCGHIIHMGSWVFAQSLEFHQCPNN